MKKNVFLIKLLMGAGLLVYLLFYVKLGSLIQVAQKANLALLLSLFPFVVLLYLIRGHKWRLLLSGIGVRVKFWQACKIVLMGTFYGILTPAKSGELSRVYFLPEPKARTLPTVLWDKLMDLLALALLSILSLLFFFKNPFLLAVVFAFLLAGAVIILSLTNKSMFLFFIDFFAFPEDASKAYFESADRIISGKGTLFRVFAWSLLYYAACILLGMGVLLAIDPGLPLTLSLALPFIILFGNIPLTVAGLGLRESAAAFAFIWLGAQASQGILFGFVLFLLITLFPALLGFLLNIALRQELVHLRNIPGNYYNKHTAKNPLVRLMMAKFHETVDSFFARTSGKKVLDVGCGEGYTTHFLKSRHKDISMCGVDLEESVITLARHLHPGIEFRIGDVYNLDFPARSFDVIIANEVLEHLEEPEKALNEMKRVARRYCIISVPNEPFFRLANIARLKYLDDLGNTPGHLQNFSKGDFERLLKRHFSHVEIKTSTLWNVAFCKL